MASGSKIEAVKCWLVEGLKYNWVLVKVFTSDGITGVGEATNWPGSPLIEAACRFVGSLLVGEDPTRIDYIWTKLYKDMHWLGQAGPLLSAISAIDTALWDIAGKRAGLPVYQMLGGAYIKDIQLYANYWFTQGVGTEQDYYDQAKHVIKAGFTACKLDPFAHTDYRYGTDLRTNFSLTEMQKKTAIDRLLAVSSAVGTECPIAVETHAMLNGPTAIEMARRIEAAQINCMWYEEPAAPEFPDAIADIREKISLPVCVGERLHSRFMFRGILDRRAADIIMPDITRCGGISEMRKIATMAEAYNVPVAPHNPNGPISTVASAHVMASIPNFFRQEFVVQDVSWRDSVLDRPLAVSGGYFHLDDTPGLGYDLNEAQLEAHPGVTAPRPGFYI